MSDFKNSVDVLIQKYKNQIDDHSQKSLERVTFLGEKYDTYRYELYCLYVATFGESESFSSDENWVYAKSELDSLFDNSSGT